MPDPAPVQPLVVEVREDEPVRQRQVRFAAVLVHPGPGVPRRREQVPADPVRPPADDRQPPALLGPRLLPPHPGGVDGREGQADLLARHVGAVDGGGPFAVDVRLCSRSHTDIMPDSATEITRHSAIGFGARPGAYPGAVTAGARTYQIRTYGCQMNAHDSERLAGLLDEAGYQPAGDGETPDVMVFNTCAVRENAADRLYGNLGHLLPQKKKGMQIAVGGCLAQMERTRITERAPWVDVVYGTHNMGSLPALLERARVRNEAQAEFAETLETFRFTSPHPRDFTDDVIDAMAETPNVMPSLHMPLQSGSDRILKAMRRAYRRDRYLAILDRVRASIPDAAITTDIIVGFPGETERDFEDTLDLVRQARFAGAFTFRYSIRRGTPAATMDAQVPADIVQERYERLTALVEETTYAENQKLAGTTVEVLVAEGEGRKDAATHRMSGRARDNRLVHFTPDQTAPRPGDVVTVTVTRGAPHYLLADAAPLSVRRTRAGDAWEAAAAVPPPPPPPPPPAPFGGGSRPPR